MLICQPSEPALAVEAHDARADGAARQIVLNRRQVSIRRRYKGIEMRVAIPVAAYRAVVLARSARPGEHHEVRLVHSDPDLSIVLDRAIDPEAAATAWRRWARFFGLAALMDNPQPAAPPLGRCADAAKCSRALALSERRPRFLMRRKIGMAERMRTVHRGEREIIAYE